VPQFFPQTGAIGGQINLQIALTHGGTRLMIVDLVRRSIDEDVNTAKPQLVELRAMPALSRSDVSGVACKNEFPT